MTCPHCTVNLLMSERQGVEIDYCPECRGVWLDRGELDKIVERSHAESVGSAAAPGSPDPDDRDRNRGDHRHRDDDDRYTDQGKPEGKRRSFLQDIFEF